MARDTIGWGFVGASNWARRYFVPLVHGMPDGRGVGVFSSSPERGAQFAVETGLSHSYDSLEMLLEDPDVDAVYISTTNDHHAEQTVAAARAGKHILCEKPLALTVADANRMVAACQDAGVILATNHAFRAAPSIARMRDLIAADTIGAVRAVRVLHAGYLPRELQTWRLGSTASGGGVFYDLTVHDADTARFLLGDDIDGVTALGVTQGMGSTDAPDSAMGVMRTRGGQLVSFHDSYTAAGAVKGVEAFGETGVLVGIESLNADVTGGLVLRRADSVEAITLEPIKSVYLVALERFHDAIRGEGEPLATGQDGVASLEVALAAAASAASGTYSDIR